MAASLSTIAQQGAEFSLAINVVVLGVLLSGIALGIGMAMRSRRLWAWGVEELAQAIVNAALLGVLLAYVASVDGITASFEAPSGLSCGGMANLSSTNLPLRYSLCAAQSAQEQAIPLVLSLSSLSYKLGWLSGLTISVNVVEARPFLSFADVSSQYSQWAMHFTALLSAAQVNAQFLSLVSSSALAVFLPAGLLLRMFFLTRKIGGAIMAGALGFYLAYPLAYCALMQPQILSHSISEAAASISTTYEALSPVPIVDLGKSGDVASMISALSGGELPHLSTAPYPYLAAARASLELELVVYPLLSLAIAAIAVRELYFALSSEFNLNLFEMV